MSPPAPRLLFCGDVRGRLNQLFKRVAAVNKSAGPFDALLCVGQFFPESPDHQEEFMDYVEGRSLIPLPTYFIGDYGIGAAKVLAAASRNPSNLGFKTDGLKICENLFWLKGSGKFLLLGVSMAYLSGRHSSDGQLVGTFGEDDIDALRALAGESGVVDVFLTNEWPLGILAKADISSGPPELSNPTGCDLTVAELVAEIKPRYHIAGTKGIFYAREPYKNPGAVHVTRFLGLAPVGNKEKQKFIHAISPTPASTMSATELSMKPPTTTESPYLVVEQTASVAEARKHLDYAPESNNWRFDVSKQQRWGNSVGGRLCFKFTSSGSCPGKGKCSYQHDSDARDYYMKGCCFDFLNKGKCERNECRFRHSLEEVDGGPQKKQRFNKNDTSDGSKCWFCLSSPNVETHLVVSIGESCYCALAKGPLVEDHVLIIPIEHCPSTLSASVEAEKEVERYKFALSSYFKNQGKTVIYYEWLPSSHANLQVVPLPMHKASEVRGRFILAAKSLGVEFQVVDLGDDNYGEVRKALKARFDGTSSFFYVELPDGTALSLSVGKKDKFPIQFGREVLAELLNIAERADWRNCKLSKDDEVKAVEAFKERFGGVDPFM